MVFDLPNIWAAIIAVAVLAYVVLDGFDLGVGILFLLVRGKENRDMMMQSVAPVWDGNETWLVMGGGGLLAVFPLAYSIIMPALYAPIIAMLLALVFRGVAFEFRGKAKQGQYVWDWAFAGGSIVAAFAQGIALGALVQGIPVVDRAYAGGWWNWLTPFSLMTGCALVVGYALLGSTWLILKTTGRLQQQSYDFARVAAPGTLFFIALVSAWTPFLKANYMERWLGWPQVLYTGLVPAACVVAAYYLLRGLKSTDEKTPFIASELLFVLCYIGIGISFYPYIVPNSVTIEAAAAPYNSQLFVLVGALIMLPIVFAYTGYSYWVFRGKVQPGGAGYHE